MIAYACFIIVCIIDDFKITSSYYELQVLQRRQDGSLNFYRTWTEYAAGFGDISGEFWQGNSDIHFITTLRKFSLRIELESFEGEKRFAEYDEFALEDITNSFILRLGEYRFDSDAGTSHFTITKQCMCPERIWCVLQCGMDDGSFKVTNMVP